MQDFGILEEQLSEWKIQLSKEHKERLLLYHELLVRYNQVMNLTAITEWEEVCTKHFLDSAAILQPEMKLKLMGKSLIDIGTGAGFPGLVLKILQPDMNVVLLDALTKRIHFLDDVIQHMHFKSDKEENVSRETFSNQILCDMFNDQGGCIAVHGRSEEIAFLKKNTKNKDHKTRKSSDNNKMATNFASLEASNEVTFENRFPEEQTRIFNLPMGAAREQFDFCTARAVSDLSVLAEYALPLLKIGGSFCAYKSMAVSDELKQSKHAIHLLGGNIDRVYEYKLPHTDISRTLVVIKKVFSTPDKYPRTSAMIKKHPL